jgi:recombination protein RecR
MNPLDSLMEAFRCLPGVGKKTATRYAFSILRASPENVDALVKAIHDVRERLKPCGICHFYSQDDPCTYCADPARDDGLLCVVEDTLNVFHIEKSGAYKGRYHILGGLIAPLKGVQPEHLSIAHLIQRVESGHFREVILALSPTVEGLTTARFLENALKEHPVAVSELARGLAVGTDLEYADEVTLNLALEGRTRITK